MNISIQKEWVISLTDNCQWNCWYCDFAYKKHRLGDVDLNYLKSFINMLSYIINDDITILVEGGEIGLVNRKILDIFFESNLLNKYSITTNGNFMEKNYHTIYKDKIFDILYHPIPDLNDNNIIFNKYKVDNSINLCHTIVIHKNNIKYLDNFLDTNHDCNFVPHLLQPRIKNLEFLSVNDIKDIYNIVKDKDNIYKEFKERLKTIIYYLSNNELALRNMRHNCCNMYYKPAIDLPNKKIKRCCVSMDNVDSVELNEGNLIKLYNNDTTLFPKNDALCNNCIASYVWKHNLSYIFKNNKKDFFKMLNKLR